MAAIIPSFDTNASPAKRVYLPVDHVYVPTGFDSNDHTEVVVTGMLPNLCHYAPMVASRVKGNKIYLTVTANLSAADMCAEMLVPYMLTASVGVVTKGKYNIIVNGKETTKPAAQINIAQSLTAQVDNNIYANINTIERIQGTRTIKLSGYNPSDCYQFDRFEFVSNKADTISVLPIMKKIYATCPMKMTPFELNFEVPALLDAKAVLLHVRAMKGASENSLFYQ
jgi:hypothetical protein